MVNSWTKLVHDLMKDALCTNAKNWLKPFNLWNDILDLFVYVTVWNNPVCYFPEL